MSLRPDTMAPTTTTLTKTVHRPPLWAVWFRGTRRPRRWVRLGVYPSEAEAHRLTLSHPESGDYAVLPLHDPRLAGRTVRPSLFAEGRP